MSHAPMEMRNDRFGTPHTKTETDGESGSLPPLGPACEPDDWRSLYEQKQAQWEAAEGRCEVLTRSETQARARVGQLQCLLEQNRQQTREAAAELKAVRRVSGEALKSAAEVKRLGKLLGPRWGGFTPEQHPHDTAPGDLSVTQQGTATGSRERLSALKPQWLGEKPL